MRCQYVHKGFAKGNAVLLDIEKMLISAYKREDFDLGIISILEEIVNAE